MACGVRTAHSLLCFKPLACHSSHSPCQQAMHEGGQTISAQHHQFDHQPHALQSPSAFEPWGAVAPLGQAVQLIPIAGPYASGPHVQPPAIAIVLFTYGGLHPASKGAMRW